jgi:hypothetical protein
MTLLSDLKWHHHHPAKRNNETIQAAVSELVRNEAFEE